MNKNIRSFAMGLMLMAIQSGFGHTVHYIVDATFTGWMEAMVWSNEKQAYEKKKYSYLCFKERDTIANVKDGSCIVVMNANARESGLYYSDPINNGGVLKITRDSGMKFVLKFTEKKPTVKVEEQEKKSSSK